VTWVTEWSGRTLADFCALVKQKLKRIAKKMPK
jgi:hypothetical protein